MAYSFIHSFLKAIFKRRPGNRQTDEPFQLTSTGNNHLGEPAASANLPNEL